MMSSWWLWWSIFMIVVTTPIVYGWGYRGWGPPYPSYIQRRRGRQAAVGSGSAPFDHHSWGWGGDLVWIALLIGMVWVLCVFWWR